MNILYFTNTEDLRYGFTKDIESSLEKLKHEVEVVNDRDFDIKELLEKVKKVDLFLFHQGGIYTDSTINYQVSLERLKQILTAIKCKKVCWFMDKVWFLNDQTMEDIIPLTDFVFLNDESWARRHKYKNVFGLHSGVGTVLEGKPRKEYTCDVAFYGEVHGFRKPFLEMLKKNFGGRFKVFSNVFGQDLADLITSAKMIFVPVQPNDEFYWDNRIYQILGHGGLAIYPRLYGLQEEGFISGKHYVGYKMAHELKQIILDASKNDNTKIKEEGKQFIQQFNYDNRVQELLCKINQK
jgi:hypothetical protein